MVDHGKIYIVSLFGQNILLLAEKKYLIYETR